MLFLSGGPTGAQWGLLPVASALFSIATYNIAIYTEIMRATKQKVQTKSSALLIRLDRPSKKTIAQAAQLRGVSASDYVRSVVAAQARRDLQEANTRTIVLSAEDQLAFWNALHEPVALTERQRDLGKIMRGET
jgi:uncharacterized protein (DUF1778 family)